MFNIPIPKALAFPAIMIVGGALQAAVGYFATRKVLPVIKADQNITGKAQSIFLAVSALYTLGGSAAMNYGVKYVLENRVSFPIPKLWNIAAFVGQALLVGGAIYYARVMPMKELPKVEYAGSHTQADELHGPLVARIAAEKASEDAPVIEGQSESDSEEEFFSAPSTPTGDAPGEDTLITLEAAQNYLMKQAKTSKKEPVNPDNGATE